MNKYKPLFRAIGLLVLIFVLWNTIILKPLNIFTVYLHELGHFVTAKIVGYEVVNFQVEYNESGFVRYMPQNPNIVKTIFVGSAGYMGSLLFAVLILQSRNTKYRRTVLIAFSSVFLLISLFYAGLFSFTLLFSTLVAISVGVIIKLNKPPLETLVLEIVGYSSLIYAIHDTFVDTVIASIIYGQTIQSDAVGLGNATFIPATVWGLMWTALSLFIIFVTLRKEFRHLSP